MNAAATAVPESRRAQARLWPEAGSRLSRAVPAARVRDEGSGDGGCVLDLGVVPYEEGLAIQKRLVDERIAFLRPDTFVLLEHPHVVTVGRGFNGRTLGPTPHPVHHVDRGGDVTYHGPGQLVGYPIVHLRERQLTIGAYLRSLEEVLIGSLAGFGLRGERLKGFTGVWVDGRKIASIGIGVRSWVSYHGFALNVATDLEKFKDIHPCGLEPQEMTSMERLLGSPVDPTTVRSRVGRAFGVLSGEDA